MLDVSVACRKQGAANVLDLSKSGLNHHYLKYIAFNVHVLYMCIYIHPEK